MTCLMALTYSQSYTVSKVADYGSFGSMTEGIVIDGDDMYISLFTEGIDVLDVDGDRSVLARFPTTFVPSITGIAKRGTDELVVAVHEVDENNIPTAWNGVWSVPTGLGEVVCDLSEGSPCELLFSDPGLYYPDGIAVDGMDIYVTDPGMGNIWKYEWCTETVALWSGVDLGSEPNYLAGNENDVLSQLNPNGRGFGCNGLTINRNGRYLYCANSELAQIVKIPVKRRTGEAGTQELVGVPMTGQYFLDGIHLGHHRKLYVTVAGVWDSPAMNYPTPSGIILRADLKDDEPTFVPWVVDSQLSSPTDIVSSCSFNPETGCKDLYIVNIGFFNPLASGVYLAEYSRH